MTFEEMQQMEKNLGDARDILFGITHGGKLPVPGFGYTTVDNAHNYLRLQQYAVTADIKAYFLEVA